MIDAHKNSDAKIQLKV